MKCNVKCGMENNGSKDKSNLHNNSFYSSKVTKKKDLSPVIERLS